MMQRDLGVGQWVLVVLVSATAGAVAGWVAGRSSVPAPAATTSPSESGAPVSAASRTPPAAPEAPATEAAPADGEAAGPAVVAGEDGPPLPSGFQRQEPRAVKIPDPREVGPPTGTGEGPGEPAPSP